MKICLAIATLLVAASPCAAEDISKIPTEQLIERLTQIDQNTPGIDDGGDYNAFLAEDKPPQFEMGLLPTRPPTIPPAMREIVRRGASALPALIDHLADKRVTKLEVGLPDGRDDIGIGGQFYADEYLARIGVPCPPLKGIDDREKEWCIQMPCGDDCPIFHGQYIVKVGDVCEVLIGQIVNRPLNAVRYQPTNILYVNSPIEHPSLERQIKQDWGRMDSGDLESALLDDLRKHPESFADGALRRLRFYYPKTYAGLSGDDLKKREAFEAEEKKDSARH